MNIVTSINLSFTSKHLTLVLYVNKNLISNMIDEPVGLLVKLGLMRIRLRWVSALIT